MNRKERRASGRRDAAPTLHAPARAAPDAAALAELFGAAMAQHRAGAIAEAERRYRHILSLFPHHAETHGMLAVALFSQGRISEAVPHFERSAALKPNIPGVHDDLGKAYLAAGKPELAVQAAARALELQESERRKAFFAHCAKFVVFTAEGSRLAALLRRAFAEGWARPRELARTCIGLVKLDRAVREGAARAEAAWPLRLSASELCGAAGIAALTHNEMLRRLLETDPVTDLGLERLLTSVRYAMLTGAAETAADDNLLSFYCALARQCFINEYVFSITEAEADLAEQLRASLDRALAAGAACPAHWIAIVAAYFPLGTLDHAHALLGRTWPHCIDALIVQQLKEPERERDIAASIPVLTEIGGDISRLVRRQYEENPYPRWIQSGPPGRPASLDGRKPEQIFDVLIAGCGTGLSATELGRHARAARILAIDLSLASLSYAKRMTESFALTNVEFAHADIMRLGGIGRTFDFIDASGVLHHLADPWEGWRVLLSLLRPGGNMEVGLYSEQARRNVVAARAMIAQRGYQPVLQDIRRCREEITAAENGSLLKSLIASDDFFSTSECRDLLFHPQEHRLTLPEIKAFLAANHLQFTGFLLPPPLLQRFASRFPGQEALTDLDCWHTFETEAPATFSGMYLFSVHKPEANSSAGAGGAD